MKKVLKPALWTLYFLAMVAVMTYFVAKGPFKAKDSPEADSHASSPEKVDPQVSDSDQKSDPNQETDPMESLKKSLAEKEALLTEKEKEVQSVKGLLSQKEEEIKNLKNKIQQLTDEQSQAQNAEFAKLSKAYAEMKPQQAAELLKVLDKPTVLKILDSMRERDVARVMGEMSPEFVKELTKDILEVNK